MHRTFTLYVQEPSAADANQTGAGSPSNSLPHEVALDDLRGTTISSGGLFLGCKGAEMDWFAGRFDQGDKSPLGYRSTDAFEPCRVAPRDPGVMDALERSNLPQVGRTVVQRIPIDVINDRLHVLEIDTPAQSENNSMRHEKTVVDADPESRFLLVENPRDASHTPSVYPSCVGLVPEVTDGPRTPNKRSGILMEIETLPKEGERDVFEVDLDLSHFVSLGSATNAVVMRLSSKLPRLKVTRLTPREEDQSQPL